MFNKIRTIGNMVWGIIVVILGIMLLVYEMYFWGIILIVFGLLVFWISKRGYKKIQATKTPEVEKPETPEELPKA